MFKKKFKRSASYYLDNLRIYILFVLLFLAAVLFAPNFFNIFNLNSLLKASNLYAVMGIGLTLVMLTGELDLSIQSVMNTGAIVALFMFSELDMSWGVSIICALLSGAVVGLVNGLLVAKAKITSFIVTLGTMTVMQGAVYLFCSQGSIGVKGNFDFTDTLTTPIIPLLPPITIVTIVLVIVVALMLRYTRLGRNIYMVGGNSETAWLAGINKDRVYIAVFVMSGVLSALAGALFAIGQGAAVPNMGEKGINPLMVTIASTIIGGTAMNGGKGGVVKTYVATITLQIIFNMLSCMGQGYEVQLFAAGLLLVLIVLYESVSVYQQDKIKGIRRAMLPEAKILMAKKR